MFVDDLYLQRNTETEFLGNVEAAAAPLKYLGFSKIYPDANKTNWAFGFHNWLNQNYCHIYQEQDDCYYKQSKKLVTT